MPLSITARLYFRAKPFLPRRLRTILRRLRALQIRRTCGEVWPVDTAAGVAPAGWAGWPQGKSFAFVLSHDVESQAGVDRVRRLAELEMALGFRSSFNFIPEGPYRVPRELLRWLEDHSFEVGVHDLEHDGRLFASRAVFRRNAQRINGYLEEWQACGFRSGFMLNELGWLHDLNILYDASTFDTDPFEPQPEGVRTIFPFRVEAPGGGRGYIELPYTLPQDFTLFVLLRERTTRIWKTKLNWIARRGGMALLDVHPDYLSWSGPRWDEYSASIYQGFLEWVREAYAGEYWHCLPKELARWWAEMAPAGQAGAQSDRVLA